MPHVQFLAVFDSNDNFIISVAAAMLTHTTCFKQHKGGFFVVLTVLSRKKNKLCIALQISIFYIS